MLEAGSKTESLATTLVPIFSVARFGVKDDATADRAKQGGTKVKRTIEISPHRDEWVEGCLTHEVEIQLSLGWELVPHVSGKSGVDAG